MKHRMSCRMMSIVAAVIALSVVPAFGQVPKDGLLITTRHLDLAIGDFADWSHGVSQVEDIRYVEKVRLCEKRRYKTDPQKCHYMYWARGRERQPGYVKRMVRAEGEEPRAETTWYRVNTTWNRRLVNRAILWRPMGEGLDGKTSSSSNYSPGYCTTPDDNPMAMPYNCTGGHD